MARTKAAYFALGMLVAVMLGGTAFAATGGNFILGKSNTANATSGLDNPKGTPLSLTAKSGTPPLKVNTGVKVKNLHADKLDGLDAAAFQRRLSNVTALDGLSCQTAAGPGTTKTVVSTSTSSSKAGFYNYDITTLCQVAWPADGTPCDDGDGNTTDDVYTSGNCQGTAAPLDCDDGNPYTVDYEVGGACVHETLAMDMDGDTYTAEQATGGSPDCDDTDPQTHPGAVEVAGDFKDNDCDGDIDEAE